MVQDYCKLQPLEKSVMKKIFLLLSVVMSVYTTAQNTKTLDLLNDRLVGIFPAEIESFTNKNAMSPEPSVEKTQNLRYVVGEESLVINASELFVKATDSMEGIIKEYIKGWGRSGTTFNLSEKIITKDTHFVIYQVEPEQVLANSIYKAFFIELPDQTLVSLSFYLNERAIASAEKYDEYIKSIIKSLRPGSRKLLVNKPAYTIPTSWKDSLVLDIGNEFGVYLESSYGMNVATISDVVTLLEYPSTLVIYTGMHPSAFFPSQGLSPEQQGEKIINISGVEMPFKTFNNQEVYAAEYIYEPTENMYVHFLIVAYNKATYDKYIAMLQSANYYFKEDK